MNDTSMQPTFLGLLENRKLLTSIPLISWRWREDAPRIPSAVRSKGRRRYLNDPQATEKFFYLKVPLSFIPFLTIVQAIQRSNFSLLTNL
jgi:hypothetical protein